MRNNLENYKTIALTKMTKLLIEMQLKGVDVIDNYPPYLPSFDELLCDMYDMDFSEYSDYYKDGIEIKISKNEKTFNNKLEELKRELLVAMSDLLNEMENVDVTNIDGYPEYLPSFDEFVCDMYDMDFSMYDYKYKGE